MGKSDLALRCGRGHGPEPPAAPRSGAVSQRTFPGRALLPSALSRMSATYSPADIDRVGP